MEIYSQWRSEFCDPAHPGTRFTWPVTWLSAVNKINFIYKCILKPYLDGNCFSWGRKWFSQYTGGSWWFNCRPNPGCPVFLSPPPWKSPAELPTVFWQTPRSCGNLIAVRIHISDFTRRNRFKIQYLIPFWALPNTLTLYFGVIYILFLKCWKVFKRTILHDCSTTATGSRKRRKAHKLSNGSLLWQQQVCNTILKCVL